MKRIPALLLAAGITLTAFTCKKPAKNPASPETDSVWRWQEFSMGVDLSYVPQVEDYGGRYRDSGQQRDPFRIMHDHGANTVRLRLWHTPTQIAALNNGRMYYDLPGIAASIRRAKNAGMAVNLDLHYSDTWADPAHQQTPAAWASLNLDLLSDSVYNYTLRVLQYLQAQDLVPEMIQVGNETNNGMLWPLGKAENGQFQQFARLLKSGIKAVRDFSQSSSIKPLIILHEAQLPTADYWMQQLTSNGVTDFDILGLSHYVKWSTTPDMAAVESTIRALKTKYGKAVMIVETAYPWTGNNADNYTNIISATDILPGYPATPDGQYRYMKDLVKAIRNGGGTGVMYWEPAWISSRLNDGWGTGSAWENNAFFDFEGNTLPVIGFMKKQ
ncbi:MAG: hypothetical protein BGO54_00765 [Sphingobacteriales bacterium 46-32]|nr:MAG: hypothetical protein BGO54_00765 [Sphingobacteriales bacterium 46-32]